MRELKPRAWSKSRSAYCDFVTLDETGAWVGWFKRCGIYLEDKDIVVELPTGLKDKNGKEIYEGDILKWKHIYHFLLCGTGESKEYTERVYWEEKDASFVVGDWFEPLGHLAEEDDIEVIGNIHENPELLGGTNATNKEEE